MCKRLVSYIDSNNIFSETQFGFRSNHSTDHAILSIVDKIQKAIDERDFSCGIFLDLSKAFDTIKHSILIGKLEYNGIRGIAKEWFVSYLKERQQTVTVNEVTSDPLNVHCGVPQGSVLGPILFLLYVNDFHHSSNLFSFHIFADDANLFYRNKNIDTLQVNINEELPKIHTWLCANRLSLNIKKTSFVIFHSPQKRITTQISLLIHNFPIKQEYCIKYLGILIDSNLNWKSHIGYVAKKIKRGVGVLSKLRYFTNIHILKKLYYALIQPFLVYGIIVWGNTYETTLDPLLILQKRALRIKTFSKSDEHSSPIFKTLKIRKISDLVSQNIAIFVGSHVVATPLCYRKISVCGFHVRKITFLIILRSLRNHEPIKTSDFQ